jgi:O-antigen/teichoic acid export membrane protein
MGFVLVAGYSHVVVVGTLVGGLNLVILSAAWGTALLFEARLWLRGLATIGFVGYAVQFAMTVGVAAIGLASVIWFQWATVANAVVFLLALLWTVRNVARVRIRFRPHEWGIWLKEAAPLAIGSALDTVYFRIDIVMLSLLDKYSAVATYSVGYKFSDLVGSVPIGIVTPAMTLMVAAWPGAIDRFRRTFRHTLVILSVAAIGAGVGFTVFAGPLVTHLYGGQYSGAEQAARLLMAGQVLHFYTLLCFVTLVSAGRNKLYPIATLLGVVANVVLNIVLIPAYSYNGSGWATVITESVVLVVLALGVARIPGVRPFPWVPLGKCVLAGAAMAAVGWASLDRIPWIAGGLVAGLVYLAVLHVIRVDGPGGLRALAGEPNDDLAHGPPAETAVFEMPPFDQPS